MKSKLKAITSRHPENYLIYINKKKLKLWNRKPTVLEILYRTFLHINYLQIIYCISYGLDHHIPTRFNNNRIHTEFEQLRQGILKDMSHIPEN